MKIIQFPNTRDEKLDFKYSAQTGACPKCGRELIVCYKCSCCGHVEFECECGWHLSKKE